MLSPPVPEVKALAIQMDVNISDGAVFILRFSNSQEKSRMPALVAGTLADCLLIEVKQLVFRTDTLRTVFRTRWHWELETQLCD